MGVPQHYLHVYQRPKLGSGFLRRYPAFNYQHTIVNQGWFDTASCDIAVASENEGQKILNQYLGSYVAVYVDNPAQPIWEGLINRITFNSGAASYTISLDEMANRLSVVYTGTTNTAAETPVVNNPSSQAIYGIKQDQIEFGVDTSAGTQRTTLRNTMLAQRAFPQTAITQAQGTSNIVHLELIGIYHTLEWEKTFSPAVTTTSTMSAAAQAYVTVLGNGATFFDNTNFTKISANTVTAPDQQRAVSYWERLLSLAESGDGTNYWVTGILPTDKGSGKRLFYYRQANSSIVYTASKQDGLRPRNLYGRLIPPWLVVPDRAIRVIDALVGMNASLLIDPTLTYIQSIQYDANSQKVQWFGADNTTARGAFLLSRGFKPFARPFGAPTRTIAT